MHQPVYRIGKKRKRQTNEKKGVDEKCDSVPPKLEENSVYTASKEIRMLRTAAEKTAMMRCLTICFMNISTFLIL